MTNRLSVLLHGKSFFRIGLRQFEKLRVEAAQKAPVKPAGSVRGIDCGLWAEKWVQAYRSSLLSATGPPLAVLEILKTCRRVAEDEPIYETSSKQFFWA